MAYTKHTWQNGKSGGTPINATRLNEIEDGIESANETTSDALGTANSASAVATEAAATASEAKSKATTAQSVATTARTTATAAQTTAEQALTRAAEVEELAEETRAVADEALNRSLEKAGIAVKHAEASYSYATKHGTPWNQKLLVDEAATTNTTFVTFGARGEFTVHEAGVYAIDAVVQAGAPIGGTIGISNPGLNYWYALSDLEPTATAWAVSASNLYIAEGVTLRYYYHPMSTANSVIKTGTIRITKIGTTP